MHSLQWTYASRLCSVRTVEWHVQKGDSRSKNGRSLQWPFSEDTSSRLWTCRYSTSDHLLLCIVNLSFWASLPLQQLFRLTRVATTPYTRPATIHTTATDHTPQQSKQKQPKCSTVYFSLVTVLRDHLSNHIPETETTSLKRDTVQAGDESYGNYGIYYIAYEPYPSAVEAEAAKMDMVKRGYKRHMMSMPKEVMDKIASSSEKRDIHNEVQAAGDTWYERYE